MITLRNLPKTLLMTAAFTALTACSSGPVVQDYPVTASAPEEISKLDADVTAARANQVDVLSPKNFQEAYESLEDAKNMQAKGKDADKTLHEVAVGRAYLTNANSVAEVVARLKAKKMDIVAYEHVADAIATTALCRARAADLLSGLASACAGLDETERFRRDATGVWVFQP